MPATRQIRKLRLRAPAEQQARRGLLLLEDALRTASLHDEGGRVVIMRQVHLGRFPSDAASQSVALALERAVAELAVSCVHGGRKPADDAPSVWFRDATEAYTLLALRLLEGRNTDAWYWPLAVPEWTPSSTLTENLRQLGFALAARDDAPAALPDWVTAIADAGYDRELAQAFSPPDFRRLAEAAQLPLTHMVPAQRNRPPGRNDARQGPDRADSSKPLAAAPRALERDAAPIPRGAEALQTPDDPGRTDRDRPSPPNDRTLHAPRIAAPAARTTADRNDGTTALPGSQPRPEPVESLQSRVPAGIERADPPEDLGAGGPTSPYRQPDVHRPPEHGPGAMETTIAGGLFFLVQVLDYCGYRAWLEAQPAWQGQHVALRVLESVLRRLRVDPDDPIYASLQRPIETGRPPRSFVAPRCWQPDSLVSGRLRYAAGGSCSTVHDARSRLLLAAWRGPMPRTVRALMTSARIDRATTPVHVDAAYITQAWLTACRRWLRCEARIGLSDIVLRPAAVACGTTHIDLWFALGQADPRIRRCGLDLDPGWVPWLRRIVGFHYGQPWPLAT